MTEIFFNIWEKKHDFCLNFKVQWLLHVLTDWVPLTYFYDYEGVVMDKQVNGTSFELEHMNQNNHTL